MQRLEVSSAVRPLYGSLGIKGLKTAHSTRPQWTYEESRQNDHTTIFTPLWNGPWNWQRTIFAPLGPHHSQQYQCHFLHFKIIAPNIHIDIGTRQGDAALNSDHKRTTISPISRLKGLGTRRKETGMKFLAFTMQRILCYQTKLHFWGPNDTRLEKM